MIVYRKTADPDDFHSVLNSDDKQIDVSYPSDAYSVGEFIHLSNVDDDRELKAFMLLRITRVKHSATFATLFLSLHSSGVEEVVV